MSKPLKILDLFSGIGGFSLGLERTGGFQTVAFCEIEKYCQKVLNKHWPEVPCYDDICTLTADRLASDGISIDVICGGFPCQDISVAGGGAGIEGKRSGLWQEYARLIGELRPRFVIVENVSALLARGLDRVLGDMAALGYDAEWHCIPASYVGAPHRRDRIWIVAYPNGTSSQRSRLSGGIYAKHANTDGRSPHEKRAEARNNWSVEPDVGRMAYGVPAATHRLKALGNSVVPQIPELIGRAILEMQ